jgi:hypothetical protein
MQKIQQTADGGNAHAEGDHSYAEGGAAGDSTTGIGGDGGHAHAVGRNSIAIAGNGGRGGVGKGGRGMDVVTLQEDVTSYGGHGGESNQYDGRGGRGGLSPMLTEMFGTEFARRASMKLPYGALNTFPGRGGDTPDTPQYMARRLIVERAKANYYAETNTPTEGAITANDGGFFHIMPAEWKQALTAKYSDVWYDREFVPLSWINQQVSQEGHKWTVSVEAGEYVFIDNVAESRG